MTVTTTGTFQPRRPGGRFRRCTSARLVRWCWVLCVVVALYSQVWWTTTHSVISPTGILSEQSVSQSHWRNQHAPPYFSFQLNYGNPLNPNSLGNVSIMSLAPRPWRSNALVLLVQKKHSSYQKRDSYGMLLESLRLLRDHYLLLNYPHHLDNVDIFLFHTGDFHMEDVQRIESLLLTEQRPRGAENATLTPNKSPHSHQGLVKLVNVEHTPYWRLPHNLRHDNVSEWHTPDLFSVGYRHMCRFFAITIWDFFDTLNQQLTASSSSSSSWSVSSNQNNTLAASSTSSSSKAPYEYIWRLDEDSWILSDISYNLFDFMRSHNHVYGFRLCSYELTHHKFMPHWWERWHASLKRRKSARWPLSWDLCGVYNNFFVTRLDWFRSKPVQAFLTNEIDRRGFLYRQRYGDLLVHSLAMYAFAPSHQIHRFLDFTYQHVTLMDRNQHPQPKENCSLLLWGAIQAGYLDQHANQTLEAFARRYRVEQCLEYCRQQQQQHRATMGNTTFLCPIHVHDLTADDLSPTYSHLPSELYRTISLATIAAGKVELKGVGRLSG